MLQPTTTQALVVTAEGLNLRDAPSLQGKVMDVLARGTLVTWDDTSGDGYWYRVIHAGQKYWASHKYLRPATPGAPAPAAFPWYEVARAELGTHEVLGSGDNPRIVEYLRSTNLAAPYSANDETHWCSAFVNWCVEQAGFAGTDSAWARSWLNWGKKTTSPTLGCIVVFKRGVSSGHVAFFESRTGTHVSVLGGNQSDEVCVAKYPVSKLLGYRVPS